jgi:predicted metal-dependent phosphoesterase TrpH
VRLDLHIHTNASDGAWTPERVVEGAARGGLDVIAIADHDTTAAVRAAQAAGGDQTIQVIPAIEVSSTVEGREVHVLGYFIDVEAPALVAYTERAAHVRDVRMKAMIGRLAEGGVEVSFEEVEAVAGPDRVNIGRPHLARVLVDHGHASSIAGAFNSLIGDRHAAFVATGLMDPMEAVALILEVGGIPMWAHPPGDLVDSLLPRMLKAGLRGLEVYRPRHSRSDVLRLEGICRSAGLLMSGGSDWHSPDYGVSLGDFHVTADEVEKLLSAGGM